MGCTGVFKGKGTQVCYFGCKTKKEECRVFIFPQKMILKA